MFIKITPLNVNFYYDEGFNIVELDKVTINTDLIESIEELYQFEYLDSYKDIDTLCDICYKDTVKIYDDTYGVACKRTNMMFGAVNRLTIYYDLYTKRFNECIRNIQVRNEFYNIKINDNIYTIGKFDYIKLGIEPKEYCSLEKDFLIGKRVLL